MVRENENHKYVFTLGAYLWFFQLPNGKFMPDGEAMTALIEASTGETKANYVFDSVKDMIEIL